MYAFSKFKNNEIISAKSLVLAFLFVRFWGGGRGFTKECVLYARENDEKIGTTPNIFLYHQSYKRCVQKCKDEDKCYRKLLK